MEREKTNSLELKDKLASTSAKLGETETARRMLEEVGGGGYLQRSVVSSFYFFSFFLIAIYPLCDHYVLFLSFA